MYITILKLILIVTITILWVFIHSEILKKGNILKTVKIRKDDENENK